MSWDKCPGLLNKVTIPCPKNSSLNLLACHEVSRTRLDSVTEELTVLLFWVKISIFIEADEATKADSVLSYLYPYSSTLDKNDDGVRYNLLPEEKLFDCHQNVGTFPSKRMVLDDSNVFEIFDKYWSNFHRYTIIISFF